MAPKVCHLSRPEAVAQRGPPVLDDEGLDVGELVGPHAKLGQHGVAGRRCLEGKYMVSVRLAPEIEDKRGGPYGRPGGAGRTSGWGSIQFS
jgi:hypothetical protein